MWWLVAEARATPKRMGVLSCNHEALFESPFPVFGDIVYCRRCRDYKVMQSLQQPYSIRCDHCTLSRTFGEDLLRAERTAGKHVAKYSQAVVTIRKAGHVVGEVKQDEGQLSVLPEVQTERERRREESRVHQRSLTNFIQSLPK